MPAPVAFSIVFNSPLYYSIFLKAGVQQWSDAPSHCHVSWPRCLWGCFRNEFWWLTWPYNHRTCFSRPRVLFWIVVWMFSATQWPSPLWYRCDVYLGGLWQCDIINMPGFPILMFSHYPLYQLGFTCVAFLIMACYAFLNNLRNGGQVHHLTISPYVCYIAPKVSQCYMSPPSYEYSSLIFPVQVHLNHFDSVMPLYFLIVSMFFSGTALRQTGI